MKNLCNICPNFCNADRILKKGRCLAGKNLKIAKYSPFFYEEPLISGNKGSGAIFFCGCPLQCVFCQNYPVSRNLTGKEITDKEFIDICEELKKTGVHNLNLVNPTHYFENLEKIFSFYKPNVPVISNTSGYEKVETVKKTNSFIDVYLTDLKFFSPERAERYCGKKDYFEITAKAIKEMVKAKPLIVENGLIKQGVIVRHLLLPQNVDETFKILEWFKENICDKAYFSLMTQYIPYGNLQNKNELKRVLTKNEILRAEEKLFSLNLKNCFIQEKESADKKYVPEWDF